MVMGAWRIMKQKYGSIYQNTVVEDEYYGRTIFRSVLFLRDQVLVMLSTEQRMWQLHWAVAELRQREQEDQGREAS
jgi:hypothetical protein